MDDLHDSCAVITGGAGGIGLAVARVFAERGLSVALWDRDAKVAASAAELPNAAGFIVDVTDEASVADAVDATTARFGGISILVNSAGITGPNASVADYSVADWRRVLSINLDGTFLVCRAVIPVMKTAPSGRIVNISSVAGKEGNPNAAAYSASKAGVIALTKSLGKELVDTAILVNCVAPAMIETELLQQMTPEFTAFARSKIPMGRLGRVQEVAAMVDWLCSDACSFSTGATFDLSGGRATY